MPVLNPLPVECQCKSFLLRYHGEHERHLPFHDPASGTVHTRESCMPFHDWIFSQDRKVEDPPATGRKDDGGKDPWDLLPWCAVTEVVKVLEHGRKKYGANNWRQVPEHQRRYFAATIRHLTMWWRGEEKDPETGLSHLAHAGCCVLFLLWFEVKKGEKRVGA